MATRRSRGQRVPYMDIGNPLDIGMGNFDAPGGPRLTTRAGERGVTRALADNGQFDLGAIADSRGTRIVRRRVDKKGTIRDVVLDSTGNAILSLKPSGAKPNYKLSLTGKGANRRLVVGRGTNAGAGGGAAPAPTSPAGPDAPDPYSFITDYMKGMDTGYTGLESYFKNNLMPQVTSAIGGMGALSKGVSQSYQAMINNYAGSAGNVASAITTPQVAASQGGTITAPNQNALGAAQSLAATAKVGRDLAAGYQTTVDALGADRIGGATLAQVAASSSGLLTQYAMKRNSEKLRLDMWIQEQKSASAKFEYEAGQDKIENELYAARTEASTQNSLIMQGYRDKQLDVTTRGQDITAETARRGQDTAATARAVAAADKYSTNAWQAKGWIPLPAGAGTKGRNVVTSSDGVRLYKPAAGGAGNPVTGGGRMLTTFGNGWSGRVDPVNQVTTPGEFGPATTDAEKVARRAKAVNWIIKNKGNFKGLTRNNATVLRQWLAPVPDMSADELNFIIRDVRVLL